MKKVASALGLVGIAALAVLFSISAARRAPAPSVKPAAGAASSETYVTVSSYPDIVYLDRQPMYPRYIPEKHACREYQIALTPSTANPVQTLTIFKGEQVLMTDGGALSDVTFDANCEYVYWVSQEAVSRYTIATNKTERRVIPKAMFPKEKVLNLGVDGIFYPTPTFLRVYGKDGSTEGSRTGIRILVSFNNPNTGGDGVSNFTSQQVYDWATGKWTLVSAGEGLGPVVLDLGRNVLSMPEQVQGPSVMRRRDVDLFTLQEAYVGLKQPFSAADVCLFAGDENDADYKVCREKELGKLFSEGARN